MRFAQEIRGTLKKKRKDDDRKKRRRVENIFLSYSLRGGEGSFPESVRKRCPIKIISMIYTYLYILLSASKCLHRKYNFN